MEGNDHGKGRSRIVMLERKVQRIKKGNPLTLVKYIHAVILKKTRNLPSSLSCPLPGPPD